MHNEADSLERTLVALALLSTDTNWALYSILRPILAGQRMLQLHGVLVSDTSTCFLRFYSRSPSYPHNLISSSYLPTPWGLLCFNDLYSSSFAIRTIPCSASLFWLRNNQKRPMLLRLHCQASKQSASQQLVLSLILVVFTRCKEDRIRWSLPTEKLTSNSPRWLFCKAHCLSFAYDSAAPVKPRSPSGRLNALPP